MDKSYDGILGISLTSKETDYSIAIFCTYLPPETSTWGRDATGFYAHLLSEIYTLSEYDSIIVCGDLNSRIGQLKDSISGIDEIPQRQSIDKTTNQHEHTFIEFLNDSKFCVLNGRLCVENDADDCMCSFTCLSCLCLDSGTGMSGECGDGCRW